MFVKVMLLLLLPVVRGLHFRSTKDPEDPVTARPVTKVVNMLRTILGELHEEADEDEEIYKKLECWCKTADKDTTKAIEDAQFQISDLTGSIEENTAMSSTYATKIELKQKELTDEKRRLAEATAMREKQLADFNENEKDDLISIKSLEQALVVLSAHRSFLQAPRRELVSAAAQVQDAWKRRSLLLSSVLSDAQSKTIASFVQQPLATEGSWAAHTGQSGQIVGMLEQMLHTIKQDLSEAQLQDQKNGANYATLKTTLVASIAEMETSLDNLSTEKANTDTALVSDRESLKATKQSMSEGDQYMLYVKEKCQATDKQWEERRKTRQAEIAAIEGAVKILDADAAHKTFGRTVSLIQTHVRTSASAEAAHVLTVIAQKTHSAQLAALATRVHLDSFTKVKAAIDKMVTDLLQEEKDEVLQRDACTRELHQNSLSTESTAHDIGRMNTKADTLTDEISSVEGALSAATQNKASIIEEIDEAGKTREAERKVYATAMADHHETHRLLTQAIGVLNEYYVPALLQSRGDPAPPGFGVYKKNRAEVVLKLIREIDLQNAKAQQEVEGDEAFAQSEYEKGVANMKGRVNALEEEIFQLNKRKVQLERDMLETREELDGLTAQQEELVLSKSAMHQNCDFLLNNFELRKNARADEVEALRTAKSILSGADFSE